MTFTATTTKIQKGDLKSTLKTQNFFSSVANNRVKLLVHNNDFIKIITWIMEQSKGIL